MAVGETELTLFKDKLRGKTNDGEEEKFML